MRRTSWFDTPEAIAAKRGDFSKIFAPLRKVRDDDDDDRKLNINTLSDDQLDRLADQLGDGEEEYDEDGNGVSRNKHEIDVLADLVCESTNGAWDRPLALSYLMHHRNGAALVRRLRKAINKRKDQTMRSYSKVTDIPAVCEGIAKRGSTSLTESEVTAMIMAYAKHLYPDLPTAFEKALTANDETGKSFRLALSVAKGLCAADLALIRPVFVKGPEGGQMGNFVRISIAAALAVSLGFVWTVGQSGLQQQL
jgi:hypothetical protein